MRRSRGSSCASEGLLLLFLSASAPACADRPDASSSEGAPSRGGTAVVGASQDLGRLNSLVVEEAYTAEVVRFALFMPLLRLDSTLAYRPYLAESVTEEADSAVLFELRRDVRWHDGRPTTAYDVAFTYDRARDPATAYPNAGLLERWGDLQVVDSFTVRVALEPHAEPLLAWTELAIMPRHLLDTIPAERLRDAPFNRSPVGNGPFRFVSRRTNDRVVLEANPEFPPALGGPPRLGRVVWRVLPENTTQVAELLAGEAHLILSPPTQRVAELASRADIRIVAGAPRNAVFIAWNGLRPPFDDPAVRRAMTMAIDRRALIEGLRAGYGEPAAGPVPPYHWAYDPAVEPLPYDTAAARAALTAAGFRDRDGDGTLENRSGHDLAFELLIPAQNAFNRDMAEAMRADLEGVGVRMTTRPTEAATLFGLIMSPERDFDAVLLALVGDLRLDLRDQFHSEALGTPFQISSFADPEVDALLDRLAVVTAREESRPLWRRLQQSMREEQPWSFLYAFPDIFAARASLQGVRADVRGALVSLPEWWLER